MFTARPPLRTKLPPFTSVPPELKVEMTGACAAVFVSDVGDGCGPKKTRCPFFEPPGLTHGIIGPPGLTDVDEARPPPAGIIGSVCERLMVLPLPDSTGSELSSTAVNEARVPPDGIVSSVGERLIVLPLPSSPGCAISSTPDNEQDPSSGV